MGFLAGKRSSSPGCCPTARSPTALPAPATAKAPNWPSATSANASRSASPSSQGHFGSELVFDCDVGDDAQIERLFADLGADLARVRRLRARHRLRAARGHSPATSSTACRARTSASRTTSRPTASRPWPRPPCPICARGRAADADLPGRGARGAQLQHHGPGQGLAGSQRALPGRRAWAARASASTASAPARSRRWPPPASRTSASCWAEFAATAPMGRNVTIDDVGNVAAFLLSDLAARHHRRDHLRRRRLQPGHRRRRGVACERRQAAAAAAATFTRARSRRSSGGPAGRCRPPPGRARRCRSRGTRR
jgi:enoyl-[acyl-carrier protein] reductase I